MNFVDPSGLLPTADHRRITLELANAVFGPAFAADARKIADANASQDTVTFKMLLGLGPDWESGNTHFPYEEQINNHLRAALLDCNPRLLGITLHEYQDYIAHQFAYGIPRLHWFGSVVHPFFVTIGRMTDPDKIAMRDARSMNQITSGTASMLRQFKDKCLNNCK